MKFRVLIIFIISLVSVTCSNNKQFRPVVKPYVLFILVDQFRQDIAGIYGENIILTPNIDKLAASGVIFDNAVSTCPVCKPYRGMLFTGEYPTHNGILVNFVNITTDNYTNTLGELFSNAGYHTGYIGKWHLGAGGWTNFGNEPNGKIGIDLENNYIPPGSGRLGFQYWAAYNFHMQFNNYFYYTDSPEKKQTEQYETDVQVTQAIEYMEKHKNMNSPFFLVLSTHPPHPPFVEKACPEGYIDKIPEEIKWEPNVPKKNSRTIEAMRYYLAMAKNIDDNIGRLVNYLDASGLRENTLVIFTLDHGEMHGSHGYLSKQKPYNEALNVPLIYSCPELFSQNVRKKTPFTPMDHLPTLCALTGIEILGNKDGVSLLDVLQNPDSDLERAVLIGNYVSDYNIFTSGKTFPEWRGVFTGQYTYVKWLSGKEELFDNRNAPFQLKNIVGTEGSSDILVELRKKMNDLLIKANDDFCPGTKYFEWFDKNRYLKMNIILANKVKMIIKNPGNDK